MIGFWENALEVQGGASLPDRWSALFHRASSLTVSARRQSSGYTRRCTFAYRAYNRIRSRTCSCPGRSHIRF